jgi:hypothetical protein
MAATVTKEVQEQVLGAVRKSQELTRDAIKQVAGTVSAAAEKLPGLPFAGKLPSRTELPGASALPKPEAVVSTVFDFLDRLLAEQRKFAEELVKAAAGRRSAHSSAPAASAEPAVLAEPAAAAPAEPAAGQGE